MYAGRFARADTIPPVLLRERSVKFPSIKPILIREPEILNLVESSKQAEKPHLLTPETLGRTQLAPMQNSKTKCPASSTRSCNSPVSSPVESIHTSPPQPHTTPRTSRKRKLVAMADPEQRLESGASTSILPGNKLVQNLVPRQLSQSNISDNKRAATHHPSRVHLNSLHEFTPEPLQQSLPDQAPSSTARIYTGPMDHIRRIGWTTRQNPNRVMLRSRKMVAPADSRAVPVKTSPNKPRFNNQSTSSLPHQLDVMGYGAASGIQTTLQQQQRWGGQFRRSSTLDQNHTQATCKEDDDFSDLLAAMDESDVVSSPYMPPTPLDSYSRSASTLRETSGSLYDPTLGIVDGPDTPLGNATIASWNPKRLREVCRPPLRFGSFQYNREEHLLPSIETDDIWEVPDSPCCVTPGSVDSDFHESPSAARSESSAHGEDEYPVLQIVGEKIGTGIHEFLVDWVGESDRTWIPSKNCFCPDLIGEFRVTQRLRLAEGGQHCQQAEIETLQILADANLVREADLIKLPKARGYRFSRRNARTGQFQGPGKRDCCFESVRMPTVPPARHERANTALLPPNSRSQRTWNAPPDPTRDEVIWIRSDVIDEPQRYQQSHFSVKLEETEQERREMAKRRVEDVREARAKAMANSEHEAAQKLLDEREQDEAQAAVPQKEADTVSSTRATEKPPAQKTELELKKDRVHQEMVRIIRKLARKDTEVDKTAKSAALRSRSSTGASNPTTPAKKAASTPQTIVTVSATKKRTAASSSRAASKTSSTKKEAGNRRIRVSKVQKSIKQGPDPSVHMQQTLEKAISELRRERRGGPRLVRSEFRGQQSEKEAEDLIRNATMAGLMKFRLRLREAMGSDIE